MSNSFFVSNTQHTSLKTAFPTLLLLWGSIFISVSVRTSIGTLSKSMGVTFHIMGYDVIRLSSYIAVGGIIALLLSGHISYYLMHKRTLVLSLSLLIVGLLLTAASSSLGLLKIGFSIIGFGAGLYPGSGISVANTMSSDLIRGKVIAIHETGSVVAFVFVPIFSALVLYLASWRLVFVLFAFMSGLVLCAMFLGCKEGNFRGKPLTFGNVFILGKRPIFWALLFSFAITSAANIVVYTSLSNFLVTVKKIDFQTVAFIQSFSRVSGVLIIIFSGVIMARVSPLYLLIFTATVAGVFTILLGILNGVLLLVMVFLQSFMISGFSPALVVTVGKYFPGKSQGLVVALMVLSSQVMVIVFNFLYGNFSIIDRAYVTYIVVGICTLAATCFVLLFRKALPLVE